MGVRGNWLTSFWPELWSPRLWSPLPAGEEWWSGWKGNYLAIPGWGVFIVHELIRGFQSLQTKMLDQSRVVALILAAE